MSHLTVPFPSFRSRPRQVWISGLLSLAMGLSVGLPAVALAQAQAPVATAQAVTETAAKDPAQMTSAERLVRNAEREALRRRKIRIALVTGGLVAVTGLALIVLTVMGGSAARRSLRRKPLTEESLKGALPPADRLDSEEPQVESAEGQATPDDQASSAGVTGGEQQG